MFSESKKWKQFLYFTLIAVGIGMDIQYRLHYSFIFLFMVLGNIFILKKITLRELKIWELLLIFIVMPILLGTVLSFLY